jgi:hypothetical protein
MKVKVIVRALALEVLLDYVKLAAAAGDDLASQALEEWDMLREEGPVEV